MKWFPIKNKNYVAKAKEYPISEVSRLTGITVRSLRNYLKTYEELLLPKRGYYNSLIFYENDLRTFVMIKALIKDGLKQSEIIEKIKAEKENANHSEPSIHINQQEESYETNPALRMPILRKEEFVWRLIDNGLINNTVQTILELEKRNAALEAELKQLKSQLSLNQGLMPKLSRHFNLLLESTQNFWYSLNRT